MGTHSITVSSSVFDRLQDYASASGKPPEHLAEAALTRFLDEHDMQAWGCADEQAAEQSQQQQRSLSTQRRDFERMQSLVPLYIAEPIITLVDGLLEGDHCVADCLAKGNFGLGTLDFLDGEVMVYEGVAYHQGSSGVKVLTGDERTPFMTVTLFDKQRCKQVELEAAADVASVQAQLQGHFRSRNVVYALLVEGTFPHMKCRAVCKQSEGKRLKDVASEQVVFEFSQQEGLLVGFWCPAFVGSNLNVPGFHFHFLSTDKQRGGHVLQMKLQAGATAYLQEIHRAQVDLPYSEAWLDRELMLKQASAELAAAEK